ncbi:MAG: hypothetical protein ABSD68_00125 [Candidatus Micrarchaeales archaeon]|jgi:hypothetical protein
MGLFGIGDGEITLEVKNVNVASGETLEGTATLKLNKDVKGKEVIAILFAERMEKTWDSQGKVVSKNVQMYSRSETLDTEKVYTKQNSPYQYKFSFVIPQMGTVIPGIPTIENMVGGSRFASGPIRWYVKVELKHDAMLSFPIAKTQEINIVVQPQSAGGQK